jgi:hypothetical protein
MLIVSGAAAVTLLVGCSEPEPVRAGADRSDGPPRIAASLDCPEREGDLTRVSATADGRACAYRGKDGAEVELRLAASSELASLESELKALIPAAAAAPEPPRPVESSTDALGVESGGERTQVRLPGLRIDTEGDRASVRMPGVRVDSDGENADVRVGGKDGEVEVRAHNGGAVVRMGGDSENGAVSSMFLVTSETPGPAGWRLAGYQARGSDGGPVVLGVMRAREERRNGDLVDDVKDLVDRNARRRRGG